VGSYTQLNEIIEIGKDGSRLNSTIIEWGHSDNSVTVNSQNVVTQVNNLGCEINVYNAGQIDGTQNCQFGINGERIFVGDFNGNGINDFAKLYSCYVQHTPLQNPAMAGSKDWCHTLSIYINDGNGSFTQTIPKQIGSGAEFYIGDFNYNGRDGILKVRNRSDTTIHNTKVIKYFELDENNQISLKEGVYGNDDEGVLDRKYYFGNYFSNGKTSIYEYIDDGISGIHVNYFDDNNQRVKSAFNSNPFNNDQLLSDYSGIYSNTPNRPLDFDGDGITDVFGLFLLQGAESFRIYEYKSSNNSMDLLHILDNSIINPATYLSNPENFIFTDFNGDGKTDLLIYNQTNNNWRIHFSNGRHYTTSNSTIFNGNYPYTPNTPNYKIYALDMNSDGYADIVECYQGNLRIHLGKGDGYFRAPIIKNLNFTDVYELSFGDFNGNGKMDIIYYDNNGSYRIAFFMAEDQQNLVKRITNGFEVKTEFDYAPLTKYDELYSSSSDIHKSLYPLKGPKYVVEKFSQSAGIPEEMQEITYSYKNGQVHVQGKGFLGFEEFKSVNSETDIITIVANELDEEHYFVTKTLIEQFYDNETLPFTETENNMIIRQMPSGNSNHIALLPKESLSINYLDNIWTTTAYTYINETNGSGDFLGNLSQVKVKSLDGVQEDSQVTKETSFESYVAKGSWCDNLPEIIKVSYKQGYEPPLKTKETIVYDAFGRMSTKTSGSDPAGDKDVTYSFNYDILGNINQRTITGDAGNNNIQNRTISYEYDSKGRFITKKTDALGFRENMTYEPAFGNILSFKDIVGRETTYEYDAFGRLKKTISPIGLVTNINREWTSDMHDDFAFFITTETAGKPTTTAWYDILNRKVKTKSDLYNDEIVQKTVYQTNGMIEKESLPYFANSQPDNWTEYSYDDYLRPTSITSLGKETSYFYFMFQNKISTTMPDGSVHIVEKNPAGQVISASSPNGNVEYVYHSSGQPREITANGVVTTMEYDAYGNQIKLIDANAGEISYIYNAFGELIEQTDANDNTFEMTFDIAGRMLNKTNPIDSDYDLTYTYYPSGDSKGLLNTITMGNGITNSFAYDNHRRIISEESLIDQNTNFVFEYEYDEFGNQKNITYPSNFKIEKQYDSKGFLTAIYDIDDNKIWQIGSNPVNEMGQLLNYTLGPNNINTTYNYDNNFLLERIQTGTVFDYKYSFDHLTGNLDWREDNKRNLKEVFSYDATHRLTEWGITDNNQTPPLVHTPVIMDYHTNGNIRVKSDIGLYDPLVNEDMYYYNSQLPHAVTHINFYDEEYEEQEDPIAEQNISYNALLRPSEIEEGDYVLNLFYGPNSQRLKTTLSDATYTLTRYYTGLYEKEVSGSNTKEYHYISTPDGIAAVHIINNENTQDAETYYFVKDHLGSIMALIDEDQTIVQENSYDAWGNFRDVDDWTRISMLDADFTVLNRGYTGHEMLPEFGLINIRPPLRPANCKSFKSG